MGKQFQLDEALGAEFVAFLSTKFTTNKQTNIVISIIIGPPFRELLGAGISGSPVAIGAAAATGSEGVSQKPRPGAKSPDAEASQFEEEASIWKN